MKDLKILLATLIVVAATAMLILWIKNGYPAFETRRVEYTLWLPKGGTLRPGIIDYSPRAASATVLDGRASFEAARGGEAFATVMRFWRRNTGDALRWYYVVRHEAVAPHGHWLYDEELSPGHSFGIDVLAYGDFRIEGTSGYSVAWFPDGSLQFNRSGFKFFAALAGTLILLNLVSKIPDSRSPRIADASHA